MHEESRMKGEYRVECKKWSAKGKCRKASAEGKCRKASADKEPTTHPNTLGGSDHVRIYGLPPLPPTSGFVSICYSVCVFGFMRLWICGVVCLCSHVCVCLGAVCCCVCVFGFMRLWVCGVVSSWVCGLVCCGFVCVCVFTCLCLFGCCVFLCDHV